MYSNPDFLNAVYPSISKAINYFKLADMVPESRDVRPLMSLLVRMTQVSPRIKGHITTRKTAISSYGWEIAGDKVDDALTARIRPAI